MAGDAKYTRNVKKCERYRMLVGKPRGPGKKGKKSGKEFIPVELAKNAERESLMKPVRRGSDAKGG